MLRGLWNTILPPRCLLCEAGVDFTAGVCGQCAARLRRVPEPVCDVCGVELGTPGVCLSCTETKPPFDMLRGAYRFEGPLVDMIHAFKYGRATTFKHFLGRMLAEAITEWGISADIVTFVPMHWTKVIKRGYNQSALLAKVVADYRGRPLACNVLRKTRMTKAQAGLARKERRRNVARAYVATGVQGKSVLVIDDVITTAATAWEVTKALKHAGATTVVFAGMGRVL